jgi:hypothetical protein
MQASMVRSATAARLATLGGALPNAGSVYPILTWAEASVDKSKQPAISCKSAAGAGLAMSA